MPLRRREPLFAVFADAFYATPLIHADATMLMPAAEIAAAAGVDSHAY